MGESYYSVRHHLRQSSQNCGLHEKLKYSKHQVQVQVRMLTTNTILIIVLPSYISLPLSLFLLHKVNGEDVEKNEINFWDENNDYDENRVTLPLSPVEKHQ